MAITKDQVVLLTYELKADNNAGELIQKVDAHDPFGFIFGSGNVIPGFEENLEGKRVGDSFSFSVESDQAYGPIYEDAIVDITKDIFNGLDADQVAELMQIGKVLHLKDQDGNPMEGKILDIQEDTIKMDFNHPLAGVDLHFSGEILEVRPASREELAHGHVHGRGGHHH